MPATAAERGAVSGRAGNPRGQALDIEDNLLVSGRRGAGTADKRIDCVQPTSSDQVASGGQWLQSTPSACSASSVATASRRPPDRVNFCSH